MGLSIIFGELCKLCVLLHLIVWGGGDLFMVFTTPPLISEIPRLLEF